MPQTTSITLKPLQEFNCGLDGSRKALQLAAIASEHSLPYSLYGQHGG